MKANIDNKRTSDIYFLEMFDDLQTIGLANNIIKWRYIFQNNLQFAINLAEHLLHQEYKY